MSRVRFARCPNSMPGRRNWRRRDLEGALFQLVGDLFVYSRLLTEGALGTDLEEIGQQVLT